MARTAAVDPIEKFRFKIAILNIDLSIEGAVQSLAGALSLGNNTSILAKELGVFARLGFNEITLPRATINEMTYRENIDAQRFLKMPGLVKYEPVTLRRGVLSSANINFTNKDLYNWYRLVNDDSILTSVATELVTSTKKTPAQSPSFRKEVLIQALDREGNVAKQWMLFNAFPISYKGGNDLNSISDEKLIEELTLTYEYFLEFEASILEDVAKDALEGALNIAMNALSPTKTTNITDILG